MHLLPDADGFARRLEQLDTTLFAATSQTSDADRGSLLRVQVAVRSFRPTYRYGEIGSHLGGSLVPHLLDPACTGIVSIDPRPLSQPDERGRDFDYVDNSTERMIEALRTCVPEANLAKLSTFDLDARQVPVSSQTSGLDLVLIDGEHTDTAAFSDFVSMLPLLAQGAIVAYHDANLIIDAIQNAERMLAHLEQRFRSVLMADCIGVIGIAEGADAVERHLAPHAVDRDTFIRTARTHVHRNIVEAAIDRGEALPRDPPERLTEEPSPELDALHAKVARLEEEVAALRRIEASTCWRATAPLRRVVEALRGRPK